MESLDMDRPGLETHLVHPGLVESQEDPLPIPFEVLKLTLPLFRGPIIEDLFQDVPARVQAQTVFLAVGPVQFVLRGLPVLAADQVALGVKEEGDPRVEEEDLAASVGLAGVEVVTVIVLD